MARSLEVLVPRPLVPEEEALGLLVAWRVGRWGKGVGVVQAVERDRATGRTVLHVATLLEGRLAIPAEAVQVLAEGEAP
jgi:hypothetical protein